MATHKAFKSHKLLTGLWLRRLILSSNWSQQNSEDAVPAFEVPSVDGGKHNLRAWKNWKTPPCGTGEYTSLKQRENWEGGVSEENPARGEYWVFKWCGI